MLEAILQVRPSDEVTIEQDDRRIINKCKLFFFVVTLGSLFFY